MKKLLEHVGVEHWVSCRGWLMLGVRKNGEIMEDEKLSKTKDINMGVLNNLWKQTMWNVRWWMMSMVSYPFGTFKLKVLCFKKHKFQHSKLLNIDNLNESIPSL